VAIEAHPREVPRHVREDGQAHEGQRVTHGSASSPMRRSGVTGVNARA
jgi:hypothetical protein